jgi:plasmid stabilization system protein ParE
VSEASPRLFIRREARIDLEEAFAWYEARSPGLGHEFLRAVRVQFAAIERPAEQFPIAADDIRKCVLQRFPYVVYFVVLRTQLSVLGVLHARRHPRRWRSRR